MAISIKDPETDRLARALAAVTGESLTQAIRRALQDRLDRETRHSRRGMDAEVRRIQAHVAQLPIRDRRPAEQIVGYDADGVSG